MIIIVISEKYLDFTAFNNDDKLQIPGHTLIPWYEEGSGVPLFKFNSPQSFRAAGSPFSAFQYYIWSPETALIVRWMTGTFEFDQP